MSKLILLLITILLYSSATFTQPLRVAVAANFKPTLAKLVKLFVQQHPQIEVDLISASTGVLYAQIVRGAPFDLFFSADRKTVQYLVESQLILDEFHAKYAEGRLALWSRQESNLAAAEGGLCSRKIVMANPKVAPYGVAADATLDRLELSCKLDVVFANNVAHGIQIAQLGYVDYGLLPLSLLKNHRLDGHYWPIINGKLSLPQDMAIIKSTNNNKAAIQFYQFMLSDKAQSLIENEGYYPIN